MNDESAATDEYRALLEELLRTTQVARKNSAGNEAGALLTAAFEDVQGRPPTEGEMESLLAEMFPWLWGPKSIMLPLIKVLEKLDRGEPVGPDVYNILTVAHRLDRSGIIRIAYETYSPAPRRLPEPDIRMMVLGLPLNSV